MERRPGFYLFSRPLRNSQWVIRNKCTTLDDAIRTALSEENIQKRQQLDRSSKPSSASSNNDRSRNGGGYKRRWDNNYRPVSSEVNSISAQSADNDQETPSKDPTGSNIRVIRV